LEYGIHETCVPHVVKSRVADVVSDNVRIKLRTEGKLTVWKGKEKTTTVLTFFSVVTWEAVVWLSVLRILCEDACTVEVKYGAKGQIQLLTVLRATAVVLVSGLLRAKCHTREMCKNSCDCNISQAKVSSSAVDAFRFRPCTGAGFSKGSRNG
jgi:hypothetical protein